MLLKCQWHYKIMLLVFCACVVKGLLLGVAVMKAVSLKEEGGTLSIRVVLTVCIDFTRKFARVH